MDIHLCNHHQLKAQSPEEQKHLSAYVLWKW